MSTWEPDVIRLHDTFNNVAAGRTLSVMGSTSFVGSRYCALYPHEAYPEPSRMVQPLCGDVLFLRSTTDNYAPQRGDLTTDIEVNLLHLMRVLDHVGHMRGRGVFTFVSSWFVSANAGTDPAHPARETDLCDPRGFYSATKLCAEHLVRSYCETFRIPYRVLRLGNVLGVDPRASTQKAALVHMLGQVKRGEDVTVYTGDCYRNVLHVDDICRAIHLCLSRDETLNSVTNIGAPRSERMVDLIEHAKAVTGSKSRITLVAPPRFHQIVQAESFWMDTTKLRSLGFVPDMDAYQAVERTLAAL